MARKTSRNAAKSRKCLCKLGKLCIMKNMSSDLLALSALQAELNETLVGARVDKIVQPEADEVRFFLRVGGKNLCLCASCNAGSPAVLLTNDKKSNPVTAPALCMLLRKHLSVSTITGVDVFNGDRTIDVRFSARTEMRDEAEYHLFIEIMNRYSNIVFTDDKLTILDAVKHLPLDDAASHVILRGIRYEPVFQSKTSYLNDCNSIIEAYNGGDLHKYILDNISGFSGVTASELLARAGLTDCVQPLNETQRTALNRILDEFRNITAQPYYSPCVIGGKNAYPFHYSVLDGEVESYDTMSGALGALYSVQDGELRQKARLKTLSTALKHLKARVEKNIKTDLERLTDCEDMESLRISGELIVSNIYKIKKGDEILVCDNYYTGEKAEIKLDVQLTPSQNSAAYYTKYNKLKRQKDFTEKKLAEDRLLLDYVVSIEVELISLPQGASSSAIEDELSAVGVFKKQTVKGKVRKEKPEPPETFYYGGFTILRGRNNLQNDELTFKIASSSDIWLHVKKGHSAHVVILTEGKAVPDDVIVTAAEIAASDYSSAVEVDYTERRNVKRQPNGHPGQVIYVNYKTALVTPNNHDEIKQ